MPLASIQSLDTSTAISPNCGSNVEMLKSVHVENVGINGFWETLCG